MLLPGLTDDDPEPGDGVRPYADEEGARQRRHGGQRCPGGPGFAALPRNSMGCAGAGAGVRQAERS